MNIFNEMSSASIPGQRDPISEGKTIHLHALINDNERQRPLLYKMSAELLNVGRLCHLHILIEIMNLVYKIVCNVSYRM